MTPGTESARRLAAVHGDGLPHLWRWGELWACTLGDSAVAPTAPEAWALLTHREPKPVPMKQRRRGALHLWREGRVWLCDCCGLRVVGSDPCAAIISCAAIQRAEPR